MSSFYQDLGPFSDWVEATQASRVQAPFAPPGPATQQQLLNVLNFSLGAELPLEVSVDERWEQQGLSGQTISWWVGYGPRTRAWLLRPAGASGRLPGVVALHDHGGFKYFGREKIADGPEPPAPIITTLRAEAYGGRAYANALARAGFVVLVHDTFHWGSRRFPLETIPAELRQQAQAYRDWWFQTDWPEPDIVAYNAAASLHEELIERYCSILGTSLAGVVSYEDRVAVNYLATHPDVDPQRIACLGLSGGGCRAALLGATSPHIAATVIIGMMTTYAGLLNRHVPHTWMLYPSGWARYGDWTDLAAARAPMPLLVQNNLQDELFSEDGMRAADRRLAEHYQHVGAPDNYRGEFYPGLHKFDLDMQAAAFEWLKARLAQSAT